MPWEPIIKSSPRGVVAPNLRNCEQARAASSWEEARSELYGLPGGGGLNIAREAVDCHAAGALHDKTAQVVGQRRFSQRFQLRAAAECFWPQWIDYCRSRKSYDQRRD
jgi:hypothetical protein